MERFFLDLMLISQEYYSSKAHYDTKVLDMIDALRRKYTQNVHIRIDNKYIRVWAFIYGMGFVELSIEDGNVDALYIERCRIKARVYLKRIKEIISIDDWVLNTEAHTISIVPIEGSDFDFIGFAINPYIDKK